MILKSKAEKIAKELLKDLTISMCVDPLISNSTRKAVYNKTAKPFSVIIDNLKDANAVIKAAKRAGLTVASENNYPKVGASSLTFFYGDDYDVEYVHTAIENVIGDYVPRLSASVDFFEILGRIREAGENKKSLRKDFKATKDTTYRDLVKIGMLSYEATGDAGVIGKEITSLFGAKEETTSKEAKDYVRVSSHFVQVGTKLIPKNPNDAILFNGNYIG